MNKKVKIGIIGCANVAGKYAIKAFQAIDNAEVISIASRDPAKAKEWAECFGIKAEESYEALLANKEINAVYIPLPIGLHKSWVLKAAAAKKHIICEKSLAEDFESVKEIVGFCRSQGIVLYENFMCDFHPQHNKVLSLLTEGKIGEPFVFQGYFGFPLMNKENFRYNRELGGGSLNDAGAYTVFMARKIFGSEPVSVSCNLFNENDVDMHGTASLEFPDKRIGLIAFSFNSIYQNNYSIWGMKGLIKVKRAYSIPPDFKPELELLTNENFKESIISIDVPAANQFELIFSDFCDTVLNKYQDKLEKIYTQILSQARALEALRISARENRKVHLKEVN